MPHRILTINPGSTSTKIAVFEDEREVFGETLRHSGEELARYETLVDQQPFRKQLVLDALAENGLSLGDMDAICCRGGLVRPIPSGTYRVTEDMVRDCRIGFQGQHASNLGALIGSEMEVESGVPAFIVDPPSVDELSPKARLSGHPIAGRTSLFHALNQKAMARRFAREKGRPYGELNLIVCHMGGGVSVGAHAGGKVIDTQNAVNGEGPFSPTRSGSMPVNEVVDLCFSGEHTKEDVMRMLTQEGGLLAYTGSNSVRELLRMAEDGDEEKARILEAFCYQIAKEIAGMAAALEGKVDGIIFTGGIAFGEKIIEAIRKQVGWIAPITVYPGEDEMLSLAQGALRVLQGEEEAKDYSAESLG